MIPEKFIYPKEGINITDAYKHFKEWALSGGTIYKDWYNDKPGYIDKSKVYEL